MSLSRSRLRRFEGQSALFFNQQFDSIAGNAILTGCELERTTGLEVRITAGQIMLDRDRRAWGGGTISVDPSSSATRRDVVYLTTDDVGDLELDIERGLSAVPAPDDAQSPIEHHDPVEHDMAGIDGLAVGVVEVAPNEDTLTDEDLWQWRPDREVAPGKLAGMEVAYPEGGSEGINQAIDSLPNSGGCVWLANGTYEAETTIPLPSNVKLVASHRGAVTLHVPDDHSLTDLQGPHGGAVNCVITNADHTNGNSGISVENIIIDYDGANKTVANGTYSFGIWFYRIENTVVDACDGKNVLPHGPEREAGIWLTRADKCILRNFRGINNGYEGIGLRGSISNCYVINGEAWDNGTHALQTAGFTSHNDFTTVDETARPYNVTVMGGEYDADVIFHGIGDDTRAPEDFDRNFHVENVKTEQDILIYENVQHATVKNIYGAVRLVGRDINVSRDSYIGQIDIDGVFYDGGFRQSPIEIEMMGGSGADPLLEKLTLRRIHGTQNAQSAVIRVTNGSDGGAEFGTIRDLKLEDSTIECDHLVHTPDGYNIDALKLDDNDLRDLVGINDGTSTGTVTVSRALGNDGLTNYIPDVGGVDPN